MTHQAKRSILFMLAGVAVFMLKPHTHGPLAGRENRKPLNAGERKN